jgi:hypothetical protein
VFHPFALRAVERQFLTVNHKEILTKKFAQCLEQRPKSPDHWIVAPDRILRLGAINDSDHNDHQK